MNLHQAIQVFLSYFAVEQQTIATKITEELARSENLDIFLGVEEDSKLDNLMYFTVHGFRSLNQERPSLNQFVVTKKGEGFSKGRDLPYSYRKKTTWLPPQLIVRSLTEEARNAGYVKAISLPYTVAGFAHDYPEGTLIVCLTMENENLTTGYANAIKLPQDYRNICNEDLEMSDDHPFRIETGEVYIHHIDMLDTEYAAMLVDSPRF